MARGRGGGITARFGQWFVCGLCDFKRWIDESDGNVIITSAAVSAWLIALVVSIV